MEEEKKESVEINESKWYQNKWLISILFVVGIILMLKDLINAYKDWNTIDMGISILWIVVFVLCLKYFLNKKTENE